MTAARVSTRRLLPSVRAEIRSTGLWVRGVTIAGFVRHCFPDGVWEGDRCGCFDDRCIGFHHDGEDACGCFRVSLDQYVCGVIGHVWGELREHDYGNGRVRWRCCTQCTASMSEPAE